MKDTKFSEKWSVCFSPPSPFCFVLLSCPRAQCSGCLYPSVYSSSMNFRNNKIFYDSVLRSLHNSSFLLITRWCFDLVPPLFKFMRCPNWYCASACSSEQKNSIHLHCKSPVLFSHWHLRLSEINPVRQSPTTQLLSEVSPTAGNTSSLLLQKKGTLDNIVLPQDKIMSFICSLGSNFWITEGFCIAKQIRISAFAKKKYWLWDLQAEETHDILSVANISRS